MDKNGKNTLRQVQTQNIFENIFLLRLFEYLRRLEKNITSHKLASKKLEALAILHHTPGSRFALDCGYPKMASGNYPSSFLWNRCRTSVSWRKLSLCGLTLVGWLLSLCAFLCITVLLSLEPKATSHRIQQFDAIWGLWWGCWLPPCTSARPI